MEEKSVGKSLTPLAAQAKIERYCVWQDRAQQDVRDKLYSWGLHSGDVEQIIARLIGDNFLNEERFALAYARGKFRQNQWGKQKIKQGLAFKKVSAPLIRKALASLDPGEYFDTLCRILEKKSALTTEKDAFKRRYKLSQFAFGRGFEADLINDALSSNHL